QSGGAQLVVDDAHQGTFEAVHVRTALGGGDDVDERTDRRVVTGPPAQRDVDVEAPIHVGGDHVAVVVQDGHGLGEVSGALETQDVADRLVGSQVFTELTDTAVEAELFDVDGFPLGALITHRDGQSGDE